MPSGSADPTFIAFLIGAVTGVAGFAVWLLKRYLDDLTKTRDEAIKGWRDGTVAVDASTVAVTRLVETVDKLTDRIDDLARQLTDERRR